MKNLGEPEELSEVEEIESENHSVQLMADASRNPVMLVVVDEGEKVSPAFPALQEDDVRWWAQGYVEGKERHHSQEE